MEIIAIVTVGYLIWAFILDRPLGQFNKYQIEIRDGVTRQVNIPLTMEAEELYTDLAVITEGNTKKFKWRDKHSYLASNEWNTIRKECLKIDNYQCAMCKEQEALEVHHITYKRLYDENVETDLVSVCRTCHQSIHGEYGYSKFSIYPIIIKELQNDKKVPI